MTHKKQDRTGIDLDALVRRSGMAAVLRTKGKLIHYKDMPEALRNWVDQSPADAWQKLNQADALRAQASADQGPNPGSFRSKVLTHKDSVLGEPEDVLKQNGKPATDMDSVVLSSQELTRLLGMGPEYQCPGRGMVNPFEPEPTGMSEEEQDAFSAKILKSSVAMIIRSFEDQTRSFEDAHSTIRRLLNVCGSGDFFRKLRSEGEVSFGADETISPKQILAKLKEHFGIEPAQLAKVKGEQK